MAEAKEQDPSIEEILESIRQIISEDPETVAPTVTQAAQSPEPVVDPGPAFDAPKDSEPADFTPAAEPLDLTQVVADDQAGVISSEPEETLEPFQAESDSDVQAESFAQVMENNQEPAPQTQAIQPEDEALKDPDHIALQEQQKQASGLLSDSATNEASAALARLLAGNLAVENDDPDRVITPGRVTLEDMTRELLRPILKSWLDENLPRIVEKMVQREIERVSRKAMDR